ncbi:MAG: prolipoprotein diacylglyceryl transferase [Deltaproteobacteria bacterium RBG_13_58_19]|nr:MAG: prolipoprotein diacylglyceryl transferase [Deltaproteobacteria bacterium RBG_13_58_19]
MYPILFNLGPLRIFTYGFFLALAALTTIYLSAQEARRQGMNVGRFYDLCFYLVLASLAGSRLLYVILEYPYFLANPLKIFVLWDGGLVFHGGMVAAILVGFYYMRRYDLPWRAAFDSLGVGMPVGQFFGRLGCFMAGCCYGRATDLPWAVTFTHPETLCPIKAPLHPTQLYEALLSLGVFGVVYWLRTRKRFDGQVILTYFMLAGLVRFVVEFFRSPLDYRGPILFGGMPSTQIFALGLSIIAGAVLLWAWQRNRPIE